jgi:hypothetical protein
MKPTGRDVERWLEWAVHDGTHRTVPKKPELREIFAAYLDLLEESDLLKQSVEHLVEIRTNESESVGIRQGAIDTIEFCDRLRLGKSSAVYRMARAVVALLDVYEHAKRTHDVPHQLGCPYCEALKKAQEALK